MTTTTGVLAVRFAGYTTNAPTVSGEPGSHATFTHSERRGLEARRAAVRLALGGRPSDAGVAEPPMAAMSWPACSSRVARCEHAAASVARARNGNDRIRAVPV